MQINRSGLHLRRVAVARGCSLAILVLASVGFAMGGFPRAVAAHDGHGHRVRDGGFSFVPPAGWSRSTNLPAPQLKLMYMGPKSGGFQANLNLVAEKDSGESFDVVAQQFKEVFPKLLTNWKLVEEAQMEIDGKPAYYLSATFRMGGTTVRNAQFVVRASDGKAYTLTFTATNTAFEQLEGAIAQSVTSIKVE